MVKMNDDILKLREEWYSQTFVKFEIIKCLKHKELCFLSKDRKYSIRYLFCETVKYFDKHLKWANFLNKPSNMYMSVASLKDIPIFSYNLKIRTKEDKYKEFNENYKNHVIGYDLFMDFDGKENPDKCFQEVKTMKSIFDGYKIPYYIMPSSSTGFHFHIPFEYMIEADIIKLIDILNNVVYNIKGIHNFEMLDNTVVDIKRVCKVPYSCVIDNSVCLPLNDSQFENFNRDIIRIDNVLKNIKIMNRGLLTRTHGLSHDELKENVEKFISDYK